MRKTWKSICTLALTVILTAGSVVNVHAEEYTGGDNWSVTFDGKKMNSNFNSSDMADAMQAVQPGDTMILTVTLQNQDTEATNWYMTNEVLSSLEDSQSVAGGGAYTYILTYQATGGTETVLYSSDQVGGEKSAGDAQGLHEATNSMSGYFYLDTLESGKTGKVTLTVKLDGETQGNAYQNTLASLRMNFAVDKVQKVAARTSNTTSESTTTNTVNTVTLTPGTQAQPLKPIQTGDHSQILLWSLLALASGLLILFVAIWRFKKERQERGQMQA